MSFLDKKVLLKANLETRSITEEKLSPISFYNTDENIANLYMKLIYVSDDGSSKELQKDEVSGYSLKMTAIKPKTNQIREVDGVLSEDLNNEETCAIFKFQLGTEFTNQIGDVICCTKIAKDTQKLNMNHFVYTIKADKLTGLNAEIESNPDLPVLKELIEEVKETAQTVNNIDNVNVSDIKTYSNKKIEEKFNNVSTQIKDKANLSDVAKISSGTPFFANSVDGMTDNTKNYVNTSDGYLYVYQDDTGFVKSNILYQSSGIEPNSITTSKLNDELKILLEEDYSLPIEVTWMDGSINYNGQVNATEKYKYCKYNVVPGEVYKIKAQRLYSNVGWIILDANNNKILQDTQVDSMVDFEDEIEIPNNASYLCFNNYNNSTFKHLIKKIYNLKQSEINYSNLNDGIKDVFEYIYKDITNELVWVNDKYINKDGNILELSNNGYGYSKLSINSGTICKITGSHEYASVCYIVTDNVGNVLLVDSIDNSGIIKYVEHEFVTPNNSVNLYINKKGFKELKLKNKLNVKNHLSGKTILFSGDSIMAGLVTDTDNPKYNTKYGWAEMIGEQTNALITNYGIGGTTIAKREGKTSSILERIDVMYNDSPNADYIIIEGGVNDCYTMVETDSSKKILLGEISNGYNAPLNENTFSGALESLFKQCKLKWKGKKIGFICTFKVPTAMVGVCDFMAYMERAKEICQKWNVSYLDLFNESGLCYHLEEIKTLYSYDGGGLHPNIEGYKIDLNKIESWIKSL